MGRPRGFDEPTLVRAATSLFVRQGYEATSVDDLVTSSGVHRGSLYQAFGSKRGLFLAALRQLVDEQLPAALADGVDLVQSDDLDLLLVAAVELAPRDAQVRDVLAEACAGLGAASDGPATLLGARLLHRAGTHTDNRTGRRR